MPFKKFQDAPRTMHKTWKYIQASFICVLAYMLFLWIPHSTSKTDEEALLQQLLYKDHFAYTLFGAKAASLTCFWERQPRENIYNSITPYKLDRKAYDCWNNIKHKYQSPHFIFKESQVSLIRGIAIHQLVLINKSKFIDVVNANLSVFKHVLGKDCTAEKLLYEVEFSSHDLLHCLHQHEGLLGILLGYGKKNALAFHRRDQYINRLQAPLQAALPSTLSNKFDTPEKMKDWLYSQMRSFVLHDPRASQLHFLKAPQFVMLQSKETEHLLEYYRAAHKEISEQCHGRKASEIMLEQLHTKT